jgi:hypothetical protein
MSNGISNVVFSFETWFVHCSRIVIGFLGLPTTFYGYGECCDDSHL